MKALFWADQKAEEIRSRTKYAYLDKEFERKKFTVKTSASISGALHIGRLSDTIRGETVVRALIDHGYDAELIWVAEDMDPLRRIPEGVPGNFDEYIGCPVSNIPDPWGCHSTYADHHVEKYMEVLSEFIAVEMPRYSMKEEYKKGNFKKYIQTILEHLDEMIEIQNRYRDHPLPEDWLPWTPICDNCGKIITPRVNVEDGKAHYVCKDYEFEKSIAQGCGHEGEKDPLKDEGKLMWKGEWAAEWMRWDVAAEGAGKEYVVPSSAWWINSEIAEKILDQPAPTPIFYEHIMIDGTKMSASLGNVVYPKEWLEMAPPELLRFFYNKKLMKTRSFSWDDLPNLYDEFDRYARVYHGDEKLENEREQAHMQRLYELSQLADVKSPLKLPFPHAALLSQVYSNNEGFLSSLERSGHYEDSLKDELLERIAYAGNWSSKFTPEDEKFGSVNVTEIKTLLSENQKTFISELSAWLQTDHSPDEIQAEIFKLGAEKGLTAGKTFEAVYLPLLGRKRGPKAGGLVSSLDREWLIKRFREASE
ncbi:MAG: lysine--tRNA ligase [Desulfatiglandales bacterium]